MFERLHQSDTRMSKRVEIHEAIMMLLTKGKGYSMLMMVTLFLFKKVVVTVLFVFQLTKVMVYVMMMHKTEDKTDLEGLQNPTQNTARRFMI
jgi:hypothetical protein